MKVGNRPNANRAKVSVCMAAYQGERYITAQLRSILDQLQEQDEVIVVDDHSSDRTCEQVRSLNDSRIYLYENPTNQGVAKTFQQALSRATGDVIFLSDQDDIWAPTKVASVLREFERNPVATLVVTDAALIDENGLDLGGSYYAQRGKFTSSIFSNLIRCKFLGCLMAFKSELIQKALPFPDGCGDVFHDFWLGTVNSLICGQTCYLDKPLVLYRRHSHAVTRAKLNLLRQLRIRLGLLQAILAFGARNFPSRRIGN